MKQSFLLSVLLIGLFAGSCTKKVTEADKPTIEEPPPPPVVVEEEKDPYPGFTTYTIQKGKNYCDGNTYSIISGVNALNFQVVFDSSCIYTNALPENQADINKLLGFSDCETHHQANSARFGWNWMDGHLYLYAYCYREKERMYKNLGAVALDSIQHCRLSVSGNHYIFQVNDKQDTMPRYCNGDSIYGYNLLPYFGGDEPAPQTIHIKIKHL